MSAVRDAFMGQVRKVCDMKVKFPRKMNMYFMGIKRLLLLVLLIAGRQCVSDDCEGRFRPAEGIGAIRRFFEEFKEAFNAKDAERVRKKSGKTWEKWSENLKGNVKLDNIEIVGFESGAVSNVSAKVTFVENGETSLYEVVFSLKKDDGFYSIQNMIEPKIEKRIQEFDVAVKANEVLIDAINARDMDAAKSVLSFEDAKNFEVELSSRGLMWIKSAIVNGVEVPLEDSGVGREGSDLLVGRVYVPCSPGGTNILERFIFKDGKIDRAAPRRETKEEFLKRFRAEQEAARKQYEEKRAAEYKRQNAEALERLKKELKEAGVLK